MKGFLLKLIALNLLPLLIIEGILLCFWLRLRPTDNPVSVSLLQLLYDTFLLPLFLVLLNYRFQKKHNRSGFRINFVLIFVSMGIEQVFSFINWGLSIGSISSPDSETIAIQELSWIISVIIVIITSIVAHRSLNKL